MRAARSLAGALLLLLGAWSGPAAAQAPDSAGGAIRVGDAQVVLSGRVQTQFNTTTVEGERTTHWFLRRVRLEARVRVNDLVGGKIQPDFSGERFTLRDAYVTLDIAPWARLLAGQSHRPFGRLTRYSSLSMPPIEKGGEIRGIRVWDEVNLVKDLGYANRDVGLQLAGSPAGAPLGLQYELAVVQGPDAAQIRDGATAQWVGRLGLEPADGLQMGASWSRRDFVSPSGSPQEGGVRAGDAWAVDAAWEPSRSGVRLLGEAVGGDFDPWTGATFRGAQLWAAYDIAPGRGRVSLIEPLLRVSRGELRGQAPAGGGTMVTPGLNLYLGGLNRAMVNYDVWLAHGGRTERSFKAMLQLAF